MGLLMAPAGRLNYQAQCSRPAPLQAARRQEPCGQRWACPAPSKNPTPVLSTTEAQEGPESTVR